MDAMLKKLLAVSAATLLTLASYAAAVELRADHPDTYTVQRGDTLWDISSRFLGQPWLWPEIWQANPQVENPHLIYPGDVLSLAYLGGRATLLKREPQIRRNETPINAVPLGDIEAFLKKAHVFDGDEDRNLPYVLGVEENRLRVSEGQVAYIRGGDFKPGDRIAVLRPTVRFARHPQGGTDVPHNRITDWTAAGGLDPHSSGMEWAFHTTTGNGLEVLGWEALEIADGTLTHDGDPGTLLLAPGGREVKKGDLLVPYNDAPYDLTFYPHAPESIPANLQLLAVTDRFQYGGPRDVVAISGGAADGLENGHVLSIWRDGDVVRDDVAHKQRLAANLKKNKVQLPDEFVGHVMIFRTFNHVSYGLIMDGIRPARLNDELKMPDRL